MFSNQLALSLGSNLGDRLEFLKFGVERINREVGEIKKCSGVYETEPVGVSKDHLSYFNLVLIVETGLRPMEVLEVTKAIENDAGRTSKGTLMPRNLDIDLLFFGLETVDTPDLIIPHPRMEDRNFVLKPLYEIYPDWVHPVSNKTISKLLEENTNSFRVEKTDLLAG